MTVEPTPALSREDAQRLTQRIQLIAGNAREAMEKLSLLVEQARSGRAHAALGFASWTDYLSSTLGASPMRLDRDQRRELVAYLAGEGMSTRAIAPIVGASKSQVAADVRLSSSGQSGRPSTVTSLDGRQRPSTQPDRAATAVESYPELQPDSERNVRMNGYLHRFVAVSDHYPAGTCWAWMDTAERVCGKPEGNQAAHLCNRHADVALRKAHAEVARERARAERLRVAMVEKAPVALPRLRAELARVEAEMARRDPQPVTTDRAAYGGAVHRSIARAARGRLSDSNVARMAELVDHAARLRGEIAGYEAAVVAR